MPVFDEYTALRELLLARCGVVFVDASGPPLDDAIVRAFGLELAALGYLPASRLERRVARCSLDEIEQLRDFVIEVLRRQLGDAPHEPRGCPFQAWSLAEALRLDQVVLR